MKKDGDLRGKKGKLVMLSSKKENREKTGNIFQSAKKKAQTSNTAFITDARFHRAMDLVREDMNGALSASNNANNSFYFLLKFLIENKIIDEDKFEAFVAKEVKNMPGGYEEDE